MGNMPSVLSDLDIIDDGKSRGHDKLIAIKFLTTIVRLRENTLFIVENCYTIAYWRKKY